MASFLRTKSFMLEDFSSNYSSGDVFQWWNATAESKQLEHGVFYALCASYAIVSIVALVQLVRIQLRVPEYGWTTQKIFHLMNFIVNGIRAVQFGLYKSMFYLRPKVLEMILLDLPGLLFFSTYTLLVLFWAEIYHQARSLPINKLRPTYLIVNAFVYFTQICIWVYMSFSKSYVAIEVAKLFFAVISFCAALGFVIYGGRLFIMLQRFPIESRGRQKKLHEVGFVTGVCCTCFLVRCIMVVLSAFDKDADVDVLDHPILNLVYYMIVEVFPSAMVLFILRKLPPRRVKLTVCWTSSHFAFCVTLDFVKLRYFLNVIFNILNKKVYNYFPYPYFVSVVHLLVGVVYCLISWSIGLPKRAPVNKEQLGLLTPVAACHALGHVMSNVSFAAVAVSFTHTVKALEPFFNAAASQFILGHQIPLSLWLSLAPVVLGVSMASLTELSFNWLGFISAMISNISFTYRSIYSKKAMTGMDSTNVYAYISIIALVFCLPPAILIEGPKLMQYGFKDAIAKVGLYKFVSDLFWIGMFYHLYNQIATNTLERVAPLTHAVGNVLKRVFVIGFSIIVFGNRISTQTGIGTGIAIAGVALYSLIKANIEEKKRKAAQASA